MSEIKVDKISPQSGTELILGDASDDFLLPNNAELIAQSGSTITIASGATLANAGTATGFAAGAWEFVLMRTASSDASLVFENMVDGNDYHYAFDDVLPTDDDNNMKAQLGVAGPTYRTASYKSTVCGINNSGLSQSGELTNAIYMNDNATNVGLGNVDANSEGLRTGYLQLTNPAYASTKTASYGMSINGATSSAIINNYIGSVYGTAEAHTCIKFILATGTIASGRILQYKRTRS